MKNLRIYLFAITGLLFASCDDAIDIIQPGELAPEDTFETVVDMQLGLNAIYSSVPYENGIYFTSIFTDEVAIGRSNGGQGLGGELAFNLTPLSGDAAGIWSSNYYAINLATRLIEASEFVVVEPGTEDEAAKKSVLAQAYALRAFCHFQLLTYFSPDLTDDSALGVVAIASTPNITDKLPRNTNGEVFALIDSDLAFSVGNLASNLQTVSNPNRFYVTQDFIKALKARMALYRGNYDLANQMVTELDATLNLSNAASYRGIWVSDTYAANSEVIFYLDKVADPDGGNGNFYQLWSSVNSTVSGSPFFEVNRALFNLVNTSGDIRKTIVADATQLVLENYDAPSVTAADYKQNDVLPVGKYPGNGTQNLLNDVKVFRLSEMYLIKAECFANANDWVNAIGWVNQVRAARGATALNTNLTGQAGWLAIMNERRAELAFEGHRYIDIKRLGVKAGQGVFRDPRDCAFNGFCTLPGSDYRFTLPIPQPELAANPSIQQNPNY